MKHNVQPVILANIVMTQVRKSHCTNIDITSLFEIEFQFEIWTNFHHRHILTPVFIHFLGLTSVVSDCDPGFYCPGGNDVPNPVATPCPIGLHCPAGSNSPVPCVPGTFTNLTQQDTCLTCPAGFYCVPEEVIAGNVNFRFTFLLDSVLYHWYVEMKCDIQYLCLFTSGNSSSGYLLCSRGFYCPAGTGRNESACPAGTYSNQLGLTDASFCLQCTGGRYCDVTNLTAPAGDCSPGYYCTEGVNTPTPTGNHTGTGGICPQGYKCPGATVLPEGCPAGTYQVRNYAVLWGIS